MSTQPLVSWWNRDNTSQFVKWDIGVVDAGTASPQTGFLIWNNRGGSTDVADMEDVTITTKGEGGVNTGALVEGQWIRVKLDEVESTFSPIGYDTVNNVPVVHPIRAIGSTTFNGNTYTPEVPPHTGQNGQVCILGVANDGTKENSAGNFAEITAYADVPGNASAGLIKFLLRVSYKYV